MEENRKKEEMTDENEVPGPDQDDANQTDGNKRDEDGNLVTPPPSDPDGPSTDAPGGDPSINPTTPPPAPLPDQP